MGIATAQRRGMQRRNPGSSLLDLTLSETLLANTLRSDLEWRCNCRQLMKRDEEAQRLGTGFSKISLHRDEAPNDAFGPP